MAGMIFIPSTRDLPRTGRDGFVSVGVNGVVSRIPVGVAYAASDDQINALTAAGVPISAPAAPLIPTGSIILPQGKYGAQITIVVNGQRVDLPTGVPIAPTPQQQAVIDNKGVEYVGSGSSSPTLGTPVLNGSLTSGTAASGVTLSGLTDGSTVTFSIAGLSVGTSGTTRTVAGTPGASGALSVTEALGPQIKTTAVGTVAAAAVAPIARTLPVVSGQALVGQIVTAANATYAVAPDSITGQWAWADTANPATGAQATPISGATSAAGYTVQPNDLTHTLQWVETATKGSATTVTRSAPTPAVQNTTLSKAGPDLPQISGGSNYQTGQSGFGNERTAGYAQSAVTGGTDVLPTMTTWAVDFRTGIFTTAPSAQQYFAGQQTRFYFAIDTAGKLVAAVYSSAGAMVLFTGTMPQLNDGVRHHLAITVTPTASYLGFDGTIISTLTQTPYSGAASGYGFTLGGYAHTTSNIALYPMDEFAVWSIAKYSSAYTVPTVPYVGNETGLIALYHLESTVSGAYPSATYTSSAPIAQTAPALSSNFNYAGSLISMKTAGTYKNTPLAYSYQWNYADTNTDIAGATSAGYTPVPADVGRPIRCAEIPSNGGGTGTRNYSDTQTVKTANPRALVAANRLRTARDVGTVGTDVYSYARRRVKTGNSTVDFRLWFHNGTFGYGGLYTINNSATIGQCVMRRVSDGAVVRAVAGGNPIVPATPLTLAGGVVGGDIQFATMESQLTPNTDYYLEVWPMVAQGGQRPYEYHTFATTLLSDEANASSTSSLYGTSPNTQVGDIGSYVFTATARGITGPAMVRYGDSLYDQEFKVPGQDLDSGGYMGASLSNPATGGGFVPNTGMVRYSADVLSFALDNSASRGGTNIISMWERMAAMLGQPDWPFNFWMNGMWRNAAGPGGEGSYYSGMFDYLRARTPGLEIGQTAILPVMDGAGSATTIKTAIASGSSTTVINIAADYTPTAQPSLNAVGKSLLINAGSAVAGSEQQVVGPISAVASDGNGGSNLTIPAITGKTYNVGAAIGIFQPLAIDGTGYTDETLMIPDASSGSGSGRDQYIAWIKAGAGGRKIRNFMMADYCASLTTSGATYKWPASPLTLKTVGAISNAAPTSIKLNASAPIGAILVFNPGSQVSGSEMTFCGDVISSTPNGDTTYQVVVRTSFKPQVGYSGAVSKTYPDNTTVKIPYCQADGTHETCQFGGMLDTYFDQNLKSGLFGLGL